MLHIPKRLRRVIRHDRHELLNTLPNVDVIVLANAFASTPNRRGRVHYECRKPIISI